MKYLICNIVFLLAFAPGTPAAEPMKVQPDNHSLRNEVTHAITHGLDWLASQQSPGGHWSSPEYPALTALSLTAFMREPNSTRREADFIQRGYKVLEDNAQLDGGIYKKKELENYNTAISVMALVARENPKDRPLLSKARLFLIGQQNHIIGEDKKPTALDGGIGYGDDDPHSDLSNTVIALEALHALKVLARKTALQSHTEMKEKSTSGMDLDWEAAIGFVTRCQNLPAANHESWASGDPANKGGFVYYPGSSGAGEMKLPNGRTALRSYGSMSYAGLLSYIYADLEKDDPRVQAAMAWLKKNYTVEENPGMGKQGLFYYYNVMAKTLAAAANSDPGQAPAAMGHWKEDLAKQLINLQKTDGRWANSNGRFWEKDPVLATSFAVLALEAVYSSM